MASTAIMASGTRLPDSSAEVETMGSRRMAVLAIAGMVLSAGALSAQMIGDRVPMDFQVVHQHNTGECRGTLTIDKWKFTYTSVDRPEDSRTWKVTDIKEFESKTRDQLIVRSRESGKATLGLDKNYRFKVLGAGIDPDVVFWMNDRVK